MPRNVTVTFDDGSSTVYQNVPDEVTPDAVTARAQKEAPGKVIKEIDGGNSGGVMRTLKLFGSDVLQGLAGLPALAIDAQKGIRAATVRDMRKLGVPDALLDTSIADYHFGQHMADVKGGAESLFGVKPETPGEKFTSAVTQGAAGALVGPGAVAAPVRSAVAGATAGAGSEAAARLLGDNMLSRFLGGLAGGFAGGTVANSVAGVSPRVRDLAKEGMEGIDPKMLQQAQMFMQRAKAEGVDVDLAQALEAVGAPANNLTTIRDILANSKAGNKVQETLRNQPGQLKQTADLTVFGLPGDVRSPTTAANTVQEAATEAINRTKASRTAAVKPLYEQAGDLPREVRTAFADALTEARTKPGATEAAVAAIDKALAKLKETPSTGTAMTHASDYDTLISDLMGPFKGTPMTPPDPKTLGQIKSLGTQLNQILKAASPEIKAAEERYAQISRDVVDPMKQSVTGQLATRAGYKPDTQASVAKLEGVFSAGSDAAARGKSDIRILARDLNAVDKNAFPDAAKTFISNRLAKAFEPELNGAAPTSAQSAQKVWDSLFANQKQWQGMRDMAAGIADAHGLPPADVVRGLENLAQITKALKSRPGTVGGLQSKEVMELAGGNYASNAARVFGFLPFERVARKIEDAALARTFGKFDELLTSKEGAETLAKLGKKSVMSPEALVILQGFAGTAPQLDNQPGR